MVLQLLSDINSTNYYSGVYYSGVAATIMDNNIAVPQYSDTRRERLQSKYKYFSSTLYSALKLHREWSVTVARGCESNLQEARDVNGYVACLSARPALLQHH